VKRDDAKLGTLVDFSKLFKMSLPSDDDDEDEDESGSESESEDKVVVENDELDHEHHDKRASAPVSPRASTVVADRSATVPHQQPALSTTARPAAVPTLSPVLGSQSNGVSVSAHARSSAGPSAWTTSSVADYFSTIRHHPNPTENAANTRYEDNRTKRVASTAGAQGSARASVSLSSSAVGGGSTNNFNRAVSRAGQSPRSMSTSGDAFAKMPSLIPATPTSASAPAAAPISSVMSKPKPPPPPGPPPAQPAAAAARSFMNGPPPGMQDSLNRSNMLSINSGHSIDLGPIIRSRSDEAEELSVTPLLSLDALNLGTYFSKEDTGKGTSLFHGSVPSPPRLQPVLGETATSGTVASSAAEGRTSVKKALDEGQAPSGMLVEELAAANALIVSLQSRLKILKAEFTERCKEAEGQEAQVQAADRRLREAEEIHRRAIADKDEEIARLRAEVTASRDALAARDDEIARMAAMFAGRETSPTSVATHTPRGSIIHSGGPLSPHSQSLQSPSQALPQGFPDLQKMKAKLSSLESDYETRSIRMTFRV
jgi:hypothetical protein